MQKIRRNLEIRRREREIELLNNPRKIVFVSDVLLNILVTLVGIALLWGIGYALLYIAYGAGIVMGIY